MPKPKKQTYKNPLDWYLRQGYESTLAIIAESIASRPYDENVFRQQLTQNVQRFRYPQPSPRDDEPTFGDILDRAGVRDIFLERIMLRELWKFRSIQQIFDRIAELDERKLAADGVSLKEHHKRAMQITKDMARLTSLEATYGLQISKEDKTKIARHFCDESRWVLCAALPRYEKELLTISARAKKTPMIIHTGFDFLPDEWWPPIFVTRPAGSHKGRRNPPPGHREIRIQKRAIQVGIFRLLRERLQTSQSKRKGISDLFLCQLAELVWADNDERLQHLSDGETLRRATKNIPK